MNQYIPNTTQVPNIIFDKIMHKLNGSELKVLLFFIRQRYGFQKFEGQFSYSIKQICYGIKTKENKMLCHGTGLSNRIVIKALNTLHDKFKLIVIKSGDWKSNICNKYKLVVYDEKSLDEETFGDERSSGVGDERSSGVGDERSSNSVTKGHYQETKGKPSKKPIETKTVYGEYNNIKLTDKEYNELKNDYSLNTLLTAIEYLSCYKIEKGYTSKSDNLTLRRWVFKAINEKQNNNSKTNKNNKSNIIKNGTKYINGKGETVTYEHHK